LKLNRLLLYISVMAAIVIWATIIAVLANLD